MVEIGDFSEERQVFFHSCLAAVELNMLKSDLGLSYGPGSNKESAKDWLYDPGKPFIPSGSPFSPLKQNLLTWLFEIGVRRKDKVYRCWVVPSTQKPYWWCFFGHTPQCSLAIPGSLFWNYSWRCLRKH